ncbi:hypothetical protein HDE76_001490 [Rhodanobacter sp. ANJX3]|uniref:beta strand repeat-containing protein n=1 Tax=Rhodanobacter sp. ANJX3 TaxID=2723083 RepID=UPI001609AB6D|nr:hypothetical protein [Rhodanobacter sp. ANJX3]MBB5358284.1 hypothetical protein [Rhodanobacter sp. ANJX3]
MATLNDLLTQLSNEMAAQNKSAEYTTFYNAISSSPALLDALEAQVANQTITKFSYNTTGNSSLGGAYNPLNTTMEIGSSYLNTIINSPADIIEFVAHETQHAIDNGPYYQNEPGSGTIPAATQVYNNDLSAYYNNPGSLPAGTTLTSIINTNVLAHLDDEGRANIAGYNANLSAAVAANGGAPLTQDQLAAAIAADPYASQVAGINTLSDGTIDITNAANIQSAANYMSLANPSGYANPSDPTGKTPDTEITYNDLYGAFDLNQAVSAADGGSVTVNFDQLGLTTSSIASGASALSDLQIDENLAITGFNCGVPQGGTGQDASCVVFNSSDNSENFFFINPDGSVRSVGEATTIPVASDGSNDSTIQLSSDYADLDIDASNMQVAMANEESLGINLDGSDDVITLDPGSETTAIGNNNVFTLSDNSDTTLTVTGQNETISTAGNTIVINGDGSSVTLTDAKSPVLNTIQMNGNNQTLNATQAYESTVAAASGSTGETINGSGLTVNAGVGSQFALNGMSLTFNGGANTQLNIAGGFNTATVGDGSQVTLNAPTTTGGFVGLNTINESNGTVTVAFNDSTYGGDTLNGSGNTIISASSAFNLKGDNNTYSGSSSSTSSFGLTGDNNTYTSTAGSNYFEITGSNNVVSAGSGGYYSIYSGTGNTLTVSGANFELEAMGTTTINGSNNTIDLDSTSDDTLNVSGSGNTINALEGGQLNLVSGSNFDVYIENSTINVGANVSAILELDNDQIIASNGDSFQIVNGNNTFTAAAGSTLTFSDEEQDVPGESLSVTQGAIALGDKTMFTINGDTNAILGGNQDVILLTGSDDFVSGTNSSITFNGPLDGGDNSISISGTGNKLNASNAAIAFIDGQTGDSLEIHGVGDTISATDKSIDFFTTGGSATAIGAGNTLTGSGQTLALGGSSITDATVISLTSSSITADLGNFVISGSGDTFTGADGSQLNVTGYGNTINVSNATITVADDTSLTIVGSNDQIKGGDDDSLAITGTNDAVTATNSSIVFGQNNSEDTVTGAGDGGSYWSAPDPDLPPGDNGGYSPPSQTAAMAPLASSHSKYASSADAIHSESTAGMPDLHALVHAMAAFHTESQGMAMDSLLTASSPTEHLHLAAAA